MCEERRVRADRESLPVSKGTAPVGEADMPLGDRTDMVYMNTSVTRGTGEFVVTATGMATEVGHISGMLQAQPTVKTPLTRQLDRLSKQLLLVAGVALIASMAVNLSRGYTFNAVLPAAVAFAIAAVPVQLPMVVTTILAWGTRALARVGAIMKQLPSTETLGSTSAINTDKTGTLTLNQMTAVQMVIAGHRYAVEGKGYSTHGRINRVAGQAEIPLDQFLMPMVLASDAVLSDGELIGDPTEGALVALAAKGGINAVLTRQVHPRIAELPFDAEYKLMATFHKMTDESGKAVIRCFVKGAPDQLLTRAATVLDPDAGPVPLDGRLRERYLADNHRFAEEGLRVIATARRDFDPAAFDPGADLLPLERRSGSCQEATVLAPCQAILKTTALDVDQWLLCAAVALSIIAVTEIRKAFLRQTVGPVRLRRSPRRRLRHRCRVPARPGSRGLPRAPWRPAPPARHKRRRPRCPGGSACPAYGCASCSAQAGTGGYSRIPARNSAAGRGRYGGRGPCQRIGG